MGDLIRKQDAIDALVETEDIKGLAYKQLEDRLQKIPAVAIERDCDRCFGACFGDCSDCEPIIVPESDSRADRPQKVIAQITFDEEKLREIVKEAVERFKEEYEIADRPQGKWYQIEDHKVMGEGYMWHCSLCDHRVYQDSSADYPTENYCPNCGARMKGAEL